MGLARLFVLLLATSAINSVWCHHHHHGVHPDSKKKRDQVELVRRYGSREEANAVSSVEDKNRRSLNINEVKEKIPYSDRRLEKMLEKAILKIITGELSTGDMLLLKSLNYSLEEVLAIRERELNKKKEEELSKKKESMKSWTKALYGQTVGKKGRYWDPNFVDHSSTVTRNPDYENTRNEGKKNRHADKSSYNDFDFDAYNRQAVLDYENLPSNLEFQQPWSEPTVLNLDENIKASSEEDNIHREFEKAMAPHVIFKIRYDDSEFDSSSGSDETSKNRSKTPKYRASTTLKTTTKNAGNSFHVVPPPTLSTAFPASVPLPVVSRLGSSNNVQTSYPRNVIHPNVAVSSTTTTASTTEKSIPEQVSNGEEKPNLIVRVSSPNEKTAVPETNEMSHENKKISPYEGLEWVEDDVYRVIPGLVDSLSYENSEDNETSDYEDFRHNTRQTWNTEENENDTLEYQNETPDPVKLFVANGNATTGHLPVANLSAYQEVARAHRREGNLTSSFDSQGEKAIEDIKTRVLALTGRFNNSSNANQVQRERLTMFSPSCQIPRNTDQETWADPFSMNMHFQLNLTSSDHVVAAKLRIYRLPQENLTSTTGSSFDEDEEDEKKIRISIYYYTKSLKKHRSKKRLLDSVVTPLTPEGTHLALDVIQGLRLWRLNPRNPHGNGNNHGLVIQVEDQDNRTLKPALYIQQPSCGDQDTDQKAYQRVPALFIRACTRYVRIVNGETVTYVNCRH
ncbi:uncharacterized protein LOC128874403 isoform X1 [Hylaeus volcanicus]|uniref:uncharacterized protein LOC128874403 isoform X1 n=1 Tax=Hylaeus volcanicus TaxID=313075 RepID=UPI0023B7C244|nr:uncharacterized protein LOC128874403 isoform X1 [Hylaeus volcanicus]